MTDKPLYRAVLAEIIHNRCAVSSSLVERRVDELEAALAEAGYAITPSTAQCPWVKAGYEACHVDASSADEIHPECLRALGGEPSSADGVSESGTS